MKNSKISVIMPVYNGEYGGGNNWLRESIESILNQTYKDFEFIIIDDGSEDKTWDILQEYKKKEPYKIFLLRSDSNIGLTRCLNMGICFSSGEYIARQDADDLSMPTRFDKEIDLIESDNKLGGVAVFYYYTDSDKNIIHRCCPQPSKIEIINLAGSMAGEMFRKDVVKEIKGYDEHFKYAQDFDLIVRIRDAGYKLANVEDFLYLYRSHDKQISSTVKEQQTAFADEVRERIRRK